MEDNLFRWVALNLVFCEDLRSLKRLTDAFSSVEEIFAASPHHLMEFGIRRDRAEELNSRKNLARAKREIDRAQKKGYTILTIEDENYPEYLREIFDPPVVLYYAGDTGLVKQPAIAVIGARKPTPYGIAVAEKLSEDLAAQGILIVSGMARGIDSASHWGALKSGRTLAVLGSGFDHVYPKENRRLFDKIRETGMIMTEYPLTSRPLGFHFPLRNRIISGLAAALVVVEAAEKSGSLITAKFALEQNREVLAVPGNITSELSRGTNWLIKNGAKPVETWMDVVEELPLEIKERLIDRESKETTEEIELSPWEKKLFDSLSPEKMIHIDDIVELCRRSVSEVLTGLLNLELKGLVFQRPGKLYQRKM